MLSTSIRTGTLTTALAAMLLLQGCAMFRSKVSEVAPDDTVPFDAINTYL